VPDPTHPSRHGRSTPHPGPLLDRGGEGARAGRPFGSCCRPRSIASGALLAAFTVALAFSALAARGADLLLFSFFRDNGQDGLFLAWSADGLTWSELKPPSKSFLQPAVGGKLMRDPCLALGPDGEFRMVWTTGWGKPPAIGYAHSRDLLTWSEQQAMPVMSHEPEARNAWAPELFYDAAQRRWLVFWSSTIPGRFAETARMGDDGWNHRIYYTATTDFEVFTPTKLFFDGGFNVIDATLLQARGKFHLIVKDETLKPAKKHLRLASSDRPEGPFGAAGPAFTTNWVEGPSAVQLGDECYIYFDHYAKPQYYGATKSRDLQHWQDISDRMHFPRGARHGTVLKVPETIVRRLETATRTP